MGMAFAAAIILIYMLVVVEFGNFSLPAIIMAPIPLTLVGIIPGHWLFGAEFTATSMIGFIALAGIIVRNSILLVDFTKHEIEDGRPVTDSVLLACKARTRPIVVTALALVGGSGVIIFDPIFKGMAISLAFGVLVSTVLTLVVIPLGAISVRKAFAEKSINRSGEAVYADLPYDPILEGEYEGAEVDPDREKGLIDYLAAALNFIWIFIVSMLVAFWDFLVALFKSLLRLFSGKSDDKSPPSPATTSGGSAPAPAPISAEQKPLPPAEPPKSDPEPEVRESVSVDTSDSSGHSETETTSTETPSDKVDKTPKAQPREVEQSEVESLTTADSGVESDKVSVGSAPVNKVDRPKTEKKKPAKKTSTVTKKSVNKESKRKKSMAKKTAVAPKSAHRRGIRLKSDIDDES
jgi:hypothetical protein